MYGDYAYNLLDEYNNFAFDSDDKNDDDSYASSSSKDDNFYNNTNTIIDMHGKKIIIDANNNVFPYDHNDRPMTIQATQQQINAILPTPNTLHQRLSLSLCSYKNPSRMISPLHLHLIPFAPSTHAPHAQLLLLIPS